MEHQSPKRIFVGVSGGVDSSVAAALLKEQGHEVTGVFIRTWQPDWTPCTWKDERRDAMRVCAHLDIPFIELDLEEEYKTGVADYMIREYKKGRTPNPDVMCNREVKFGGFLSWAKKHGADYVATGHYAKRSEHNGLVQLERGIDTSKDQSYFLWTLTQGQLSSILFPLGDIQKSEVRALAERFALPTSTKKDSQGICFIGDIDMKEFLSHYIEEKEGDVCNEQGEIIGSHQGVFFFTLGQRHGFHINREHKGENDAPYYVVYKDIESNRLVVSMNPHHSENHDALVHLEEMIDNQGIFCEGDSYEAEIRYHGTSYPVVLDSYDKKAATGTVKWSEEAPLVASGQSIVLYKGRQCLGGGIVV